MKVDYKFSNDKTEQLFRRIINNEIDTLLGEIGNTQSPIEELLYIALNHESKDLHQFYIHTQRKFSIGEKNYFADMAIEIIGTFEYVCIVECDGHDYHERTKEQAARDRSRDRAFQSIGIPVFRFTGSEIHEDATKCAREVVRYLEKLS